MRIRGLDFLRGIAIIGVLFRHSETETVFSAAGGYGVDLFFVLSGFLVTGLLLNEYRKTGEVRVKRFLIRRGFKIYPSFYIFIAASVFIYAVFFKNYFEVSSVLSEIFFMQSYLSPMWLHTWSLAVEEHFYFLLSVLVFLSIKFGWIENRKAVITFLISVIVVVSTLRFIHCLNLSDKPFVAFFATHLRIDGLFTGSLLCYLYNFRKNIIEEFYRHRLLFIALSVLFIAPAFILKSDNFFMVTFGFNFLHVAFAFLILLSIDERGESFLFGNSFIKKVTLFISFIGIHSYSIYLWHMIVQNLLLRAIPNMFVETIAFFSTAIIVGILSSLLIEKYFLRIREQYFPKV